MKQRLISAFTGLFVFFSLLAFAGKPGLYFICYSVTTAAIWEFSKLFSHLSNNLRYFYILTNILCFSVLTFWPEQSFVISMTIITFYISTLLIVNLKTSNIFSLLNSVVWSLFGFVYLGFFPSYLLKLSLDWGGAALVTVMLISFFGDTMAYFVGRYLGKNKLSPNLSPQKTWEGLLGGVIIGSVFFAGSISYFFTIPKSVFNEHFFYLCFAFLLTGLCSQLGDLLESLIKRVSGVKDAGSIMPGHGGVLDRIDGLFFVAPIFYFLFSSIFSKV